MLFSITLNITKFPAGAVLCFPRRNSEKPNNQE